jgi:peptidyl-tRNA hydrolase
VGIGRPMASSENRNENEVIDYVLGEFTGNEKKIIEAVIPIVSDSLDSLLVDGLTLAMNKYNGTDLKKTL